MKSIDDLENDPSNKLECGIWGEVYDGKDGECLMCPWCGTSRQLEAEDVARLDDFNDYKTECEECGKTFYFRPEHIINLYSKRKHEGTDDVEEFY